MPNIYYERPSKPVLLTWWMRVVWDGAGDGRMRLRYKIQLNK